MKKIIIFLMAVLMLCGCEPTTTKNYELIQLKTSEQTNEKGEAIFFVASFTKENEIYYRFYLKSISEYNTGAIDFYEEKAIALLCMKM